MGQVQICDIQHYRTISERLADIDIATFRYQFPYMGTGWRGVENPKQSHFRPSDPAAAAAHQAAPDLSILVGGHSYSGRMSSMSAAKEPIENVKGLIFFAFPLHPSGREGTETCRNISLM